MMAFGTNEMVAKKATLVWPIHPFGTIHLLGGPNWCRFGMCHSPIQQKMPLGRAKLVPVLNAPFTHSAQYISWEGQIGAGLVCAIHPFGTICLLGGPNWCRFGMRHSPIWHNMPLGRAKLVLVWYAPFTHLAQYTSMEGQIGASLECAIHPFGIIHLLRRPNWCRFGMRYSPIKHNMPLGRAKLVLVWNAPFIHSAQYTSWEGQTGAGLVCAIHPFGTIHLLGRPNWCQFGMCHSPIWHNTPLGRAKLVANQCN